MIRVGLIAALCVAVVTLGFADTAKLRKSAADATGVARKASLPAAQGLPLPVALGGPFALIDQYGDARSEVDPAGHLQLLYFGYANCHEICSVALPQMAEVAQALADRGVAITPVLITVDPARDTVDALGPSLAKYGPDFVGLTGDAADLAVAYKAFSIDSSFVFDDLQYGPVYAHGSYLYLLDAKGGFLTVIPPILTSDRVVDLIAAYAPRG